MTPQGKLTSKPVVSITVGWIISCLLCVFAMFLFSILSGTPIQILQLICYLFPVFVVLFCKNHLELAFIPFALQAFFEVLEIIFNISSLFPLSLSGILNLGALASKIAMLGLIFLSLYQPVSIKIKKVCAIIYVILEIIPYLIDCVAGHVTGISILNSLVPMYMFFCIFILVEQYRFSGIKPLPVIAAFLLCGVTVFGVLHFAKNFNFEHSNKSNNSYLCSNCNGTGVIYGWKECSHCVDGIATNPYSVCSYCSGNGIVQGVSSCPACDGRGNIEYND